MPLSAQHLAKRLWDGEIKTKNEKTLSIVPAPDLASIKKSSATAIDLRLGRWFKTLRLTKITKIHLDDQTHEASISSEHYVRFDSGFVLHPGQFVLGITLEWMQLPNDLSGYVTGKSSWGRRGLVIETAAGIHPGFTGCLTLELANIGTTPIELSPGMQICQVFFHDVEANEAATATQFIGYRKPILGKVKRDKIAVALKETYFS